MGHFYIDLTTTFSGWHPQMKTRRISLWAGRQANLIPASFYKNICGLCGNLFMSICQNTTSIGSASDTVNVPTSRPPSRSLKT